MNNQVSEEVAKQVTFHSCLLQVLQNRTETLEELPKVYFQEVKKTGNMFKKAIDKRLNQIYAPCNGEEIDQGMELINFIADKLDECWEFYNEKVTKKEI